MSSKNIRRLITLGLVVVLWVVFALTTKNFVSMRNTLQLLKESAFVGLIAVGMCFVMVGGGIDLSAGGIICVVAILCSRISFTGIPGVIVLLCGVILGAIIGSFNGLLVTKFHLTEFVATLASGFVYSGLGLVFAFHQNGALISKSITNQSFLAIGKSVGGLYWITVAWVIVVAIALIAMTRTSYGTHTYALGSNAKSAQMSGINNNFIKATGFIICGATAGLASGMQVAYQSAASATLGTGYEFQAIAACVVGGVVLGGGKGDQLGAGLGALFMVLILNGLNKYGLNSAWQYVAMGVIIVVATVFDSGFNKIISKRQEIKALQKAQPKKLQAGGVE